MPNATGTSVSACRKAKPCSWPLGSTIFKQGDPSRYFYVIKSGVVRVSRETHGKSIDLGLLGPGDVLGILSAIERRPQYVSATAVTPAAVFAMDARDLVDVSDGSDRPAVMVIRALAKYLRETGEQLEEVRAKLSSEE